MKTEALNQHLNLHPSINLKAFSCYVQSIPSTAYFLFRLSSEQFCILCLNQEIRCFCGAVHIILAELVCCLHSIGLLIWYEPRRGKSCFLHGDCCIHVNWNAYSHWKVCFVLICILKNIWIKHWILFVMHEAYHWLLIESSCNSNQLFWKNERLQCVTVAQSLLLGCIFESFVLSSVQLLKRKNGILFSFEF